MLLSQVLIFVTVGLTLTVIATCVGTFFTEEQRPREASEFVPCRTYVEAAGPAEIIP